MQDAAPERITDLLRDDDLMYVEDDTAADMDADRAETPRAAAPQAQAPQPARERVPIPMPKRQGSSGALDRPSPQRNGAVVPARPTGPGSLPEPSTCRYFIIKSNSEYNIKLSVQTGVWSTKVCRPHSASRPVSCRRLSCSHWGPPATAFAAACQVRSQRQGSAHLMLTGHTSGVLCQGAWGSCW